MSGFPGDELIVGGEVDEIEVSLRVAGDNLDPDEVTRLLGVDPTFSARKGDSRGSPPVVQATGVWTYTLPPSTEWELTDALQEVLGRLPFDPSVWSYLAERYDVSFFCGLFLRSSNRGTRIPVDIVEQLAGRGIAIDLDIYSLG